MLTAAQVAQLLGISERSVYALAAAKKIAHHRFGRAVRFREVPHFRTPRPAETARPARPPR